MAENENPEQPADEAPAAAPVDDTYVTPVTPAPAPPTTPQPRLRDHVFSFRSVVAVGVATLLLGGAGGAALVAVTNDGHDDGPRIARFGDGPGRYGNDGPGGGGFAPPGFQQDGPRSAPGNGSGQEDSQPDSGSNS
ncbi:MAG: hypothetical protein EOO67_07960 [Microbacterium sp.]|nr:MAG: hypothetical protein EOO67_07960 [Microbacterium sp.]